MANVILPSVILLIVVGINCGCMKLVKMNPDIISGFELGNNLDQRKKDLAWVGELRKYMRIANIVTLTGGIAGIVSCLPTVYILSLLLPIYVASLTAYIRRDDAKHKGMTTAIIISLLVAIVFTLLLIFYAKGQADL